ncbi:hypothetical protein MKW94_026003 [Papaver nudicaule]|uniref:Uncharacterized protein n=1 Tax=Papaver nudicaule TaxID=74823 RepID=A0AA41RYA5_PAPNU|nr:hypothetical protein [Papaver nudicaule]
MLVSISYLNLRLLIRTHLFICLQPGILIVKQNSEGDTALHIAARLGLSGTVAFLIRHMDACGIDSGMVQELKDNNGKNFLHVAAENGSVKVIKYILRKSNSVETVINGVDNKGNTPLHLVLKSKSVRCVRILSRDKRVNKKAVNNENLTALHILLRDHQLMLTDAQEEFFKKGYKYLSTEGGWLCCGSLWCGKRIKVDKSNDKYEAMADEKIMKLEQSANKMASRQVLLSLLMVCVIT